MLPARCCNGLVLSFSGDADLLQPLCSFRRGGIQEALVGWLSSGNGFGLGSMTPNLPTGAWPVAIAEHKCFIAHSHLKLDL